MLITKILNAAVNVISPFSAYTYEFEVMYNSCESPTIGSILAQGSFTATGNTTVTASITFDDECLITVKFTVFYNDTICQQNYFDVTNNIVDPDVHWECIGGNCIPKPGIYQWYNPFHFNSSNCGNMCPQVPALLYSCNDGCEEATENGEYVFQNLCLQNCNQEDVCENSQYGYGCTYELENDLEYNGANGCTILHYHGSYSTVQSCYDLCPTAGIIPGNSGSFYPEYPVNECGFINMYYDCETELFYYYVILPAITNPYTGGVTLFLAQSQLIFDYYKLMIITDVTATIYYNTEQANFIHNGGFIVQGSSQPNWTNISEFPFFPPIVGVTMNSSECGLGSGYGAAFQIAKCLDTNEPLDANIEFNCELDVSGGVYLVEISANGGYPSYYYNLEYVIDGVSYYQYTTQDGIWWDGEPIQLNIGNELPDSLTLTITDYRNRCYTTSLIPNCSYLCNPDYEVSDRKLYVDILLDFSGSSTGNQFPQMITDTGGYSIVADLHLAVIDLLLNYYENNINLLNVNATAGLTFRLLMYGGPYEKIDDDCHTSNWLCPTAEYLNSAMLNYLNSFSAIYDSTTINNVRTIINNTVWCSKDSNNNYTYTGEDTLRCAITMAKEGYPDNDPKRLVIVLTDYHTAGLREIIKPPCDYGCGPLSYLANENNIYIIRSGYYPKRINTLTNSFAWSIAREAAVNNGYPYDIYLSEMWREFGVNKVTLLNRTPEYIRDFMLYIIDYYRNGFQLPCYTVSGNYFDDCPADCITTGYTCYNNCMSPVTGGQYTTSGECLEICPTSCQTYLGWGSYICNTNTVEYEIENLNGEYSVDLGICYGYTEGMTYPTGSFVCNEDISTQQSVTINITDSLGCTAQIIVPIICDNNPCESTIAGTFVSGQSSTTTNDCDRVVPPITNNWHCQGEDCTYENIYTSPNGLSGFYEYKYRKIVQGINSCPNSIVAYYAFVPANNKYLAYPTQSKIVVNSNTYYNGSYNVLTSNITPYLSVLSSNNGTINMTVVDDWSIDNVGNDLQVRNYIRDAFDLWGELISYAFGINFSFDMCLWNEPESNTTTSEYKADFYVSMIQPNPIDNLNIFYTGFTANGMPITYDGFGTPLNYTDIALAKGGVIVINSESNANWVSGTPVSGEVNFKAQIFNFIGHSLGLRSPYYEAAVSSTANTCAPDGCISDCEANSLFSIYNPTTFNTFMAMVLQGADIDSYIVDGLLNDAICVECLQKRYLTV